MSELELELLEYWHNYVCRRRHCERCDVYIQKIRELYMRMYA